MGKSDFLQIGNDVKGFKVMGLKDAPTGITAQILWDLWDMVVKIRKAYQEVYYKVKVPSARIGHGSGHSRGRKHYGC